MAKGYDMFLSLHSNYCDDENVDRVVIIAPNNSTSLDLFAAKLANCIKKVMSVDDNSQIFRKSDRFGNEYYGVLRGAKDVSVKRRFIVEHSFHSNMYASKWLYEDKNLKVLAEVEGDCIAEYFELKKKIPKYIKVIKDVNYRNAPSFKVENVIGVAKVGEIFTVVDRVKSDTTTEMFKLKSGYYITTSKSYVEEYSK